MVAIHQNRPLSEARQALQSADRQLFQFALVMAALGTAVMLLFTFSLWPVVLGWAVCAIATFVGMLGNRFRSGSGTSS